MSIYTASIPLPTDFDVDDDWQLLATALAEAQGADAAAALGVPEVVARGRAGLGVVVDIEAATAPAAWAVVRRVEDVLRGHGVEWVGRSDLTGDNLVDC